MQGSSPHSAEPARQTVFAAALDTLD